MGRDLFFRNITLTLPAYLNLPRSYSQHGKYPPLTMVVSVSGWSPGWEFLSPHGIGAAGARFFGYVFDTIGSYKISFILFELAPLLSALLSLVTRTLNQ